MARFNNAGVRATGRPKDVVKGATVNHQGAPAFGHGLRGELYSLAAVNLVGQDTFHEKGTSRDARYNNLVELHAVGDWEWLRGLLRWLRSDANIRTASLTGAAHAVSARLKAGQHDGNAELIDSVIQRGEEITEFLAYWQLTFGRALPNAVRAGLGMAIRRLFTERNVLKWDSDARGLRFADVLELVHPKPRTERGEGDWQGALFKYLLDERHHGDGDISTVPMIAARKRWYGLDDQRKLASLADGSAFTDAGITWENAVSDLKARVGAKKVWDAMAPHLPYMAALRNLRNMDEAGIDPKRARALADRLADPAEVAKSRQFPFRFYTAYREAPSDRWKQALDDAINSSLKSVPELPGRTLVLIDTSASMTYTKMSQKSTVMMSEVASIFGVTLAQRNQGRVDLFGFADGQFRHNVKPGQGVLSAARDFVQRTGEVGHGTNISGAIRNRLDGHDRVFVISDMQCRVGSLPVPDGVKLYGVSPVGYASTVIDTRLKGRYEFGGLTDQVFAQVLALEAGYDEKWPWLA